MPDRRVVTLETIDHVAWITLDDVQRRNSLNPALVGQLTEACAAVAADPAVRVVVLRANGPVFSSGGDLDALLSPAADPTAVYAGFRALEALPMPVVVAVHAPMIGAGVSFLFAADVAVAAHGATFDPRFLDIAVHPGGGHLWKLEQRVGRPGAAAMVLLGDVLTADEAVVRGLVWRSVPDGELDGAVRRLVRRVVTRSPDAVRRTKATLRLNSAITDPRTAAEVEQIAQDWSMRQPAFTAAVEDLRRRVGR